jgi:mono/diheme cytochrome c family protein
MLLPAMRRTLLLIPILAAVVLPACGTTNIDVPQESAELRRGAYLFQQRCSGCHTLEVSGSEGSAVNTNDREYKDGPNFNVRTETYDQVRYAIVNGGYSSGPMPQNIVTGEDLDDVAKFVSTYAGRDAQRTDGLSKPSGGPQAPGGDQDGDAENLEAP